MSPRKLTISLISLLAVGCGQSESSVMSNSVLMEEPDHRHYHVHGVDVSHEHAHRNEKHTGHEHKHIHDRNEPLTAELQILEKK